MKRLTMHITLAALACLLIAQGAGAAEPKMGTSLGYDLDMLWSKAQAAFDLSANDAVLLLEREHVTVLPDGGKRTLVHRVVWIGTGVGIRAYADLRIPWDSAVSTLQVLRLRTWRDGRWWPDPEKISPTAVVETLPFAVADADDYTAQRETMLLHDGIELPCILETAYEIDETGEQGRGCDGMFVFRRADPTALIEYSLGVPPDTQVPLFVSDEALAPQKSEENGVQTSVWRMENTPPLGSPHIAEPAIEAPYLLWSTWKDWMVLGRYVSGAFDGAAVIDAALIDSVASRTARIPGDAARAHAAAGLIDEWTRPVDIALPLQGTSPRPAQRTYETAYGDALDRAALAAAVFRAAGLDAQVAFLGYDTRRQDTNVPVLSRFNALRVWVSGNGIRASFDPAGGGLSLGYTVLLGRVIWIPATGAVPDPLELAISINTLELDLTVDPGGAEGWGGKGYLRGVGLLAPYGEMAGTGDEALSYLGRLAGSVLSGAEAKEYSFEQFHPAHASGGFSFDLPAGELDAQGRERLVLGDPAGGIMSMLPGDVRLYEESRTSPVVVPASMIETLTLRVKTGDREVAGSPAPVSIVNEAGRFTIAVTEDDGWLTVTRELTLEPGKLAPQKWPLLRALLLGYGDAAGRTVLLR